MCGVRVNTSGFGRMRNSQRFVPGFEFPADVRPMPRVRFETRRVVSELYSVAPPRAWRFLGLSDDAFRSKRVSGAAFRHGKFSEHCVRGAISLDRTRRKR